MQPQLAGPAGAAAASEGYVAPKPWKKWAPTLMLAAAIMQSCHGCEHIAQVMQAKVFHVWPDDGILGSSLAAEEWTHFGFNWAFLIAFSTAVWAFGPEARARWKAQKPRTYLLIKVLIAEEIWHCFEHTVRMVQWFENGHAPEPGFLGHWLDIVYLHATYNVIAMTLVLIIVGSLKVDGQVNLLKAHRRRHGTEPLPATRDAQLFGAVSLIGCAFFMILSDTVGPTPIGNAVLETHRAIAAHVSFAFSSFFGMLAFMFMLGSLPTLMRLAGGGSTLARIGALATGWGATCLVALMGVLLLAAEGAAVIAKGQASMQPYVHLSERFLHPHGFMLILDSGMPILAVGLPLLAAALFIRGTLPLYQTVAISVGIIAQILGHYRYEPAIYQTGNYLLGVGLISIAVSLLKRLPASQERPVPLFATVPARAEGPVGALVTDGVASVV